MLLSLLSPDLQQYRIKPELAPILVQFQRSATKTETSKQILRNLPFPAPPSPALAIMLIHLAAIEAESSHLFEAGKPSAKLRENEGFSAGPAIH